MAEDIATLGIEVSSTGVTAANEALGNLSKTAKTAEDATKTLGSSYVVLAEKLQASGLSAKEIADALTNLGLKTKEAASIVDGLSASTTNVAASSTEASGSVDGFTASVTRATEAVGALNSANAQLNESSRVSLASRLGAETSAASGFANFQTRLGNSGGGFGGGGSDEESGGIGKFNDRVDQATSQRLPLFRIAFLAYMAKSFAESVVGAAEAGEKIREFAEAANLSTDAYQKFGFAALQVGIDQTKFNTSIDQFSRAVGAAERGNKTLQAAFADTGLSVHDLFSLSTEEAFLRFSDGLKNIGSAAQRTAIDTQVFGRGGKQMGDLMVEGSKGIKQAGDEAQKLGAILSDQDIGASQQVTAEFRLLGQEMSVVAERSALSLAPQILDLAEAFVKAGQSVVGFSQHIRELIGTEDGLGGLISQLHQLQVEQAIVDRGGAAGFLGAITFGGSHQEEIAKLKAQINARRGVPNALDDANTSLTSPDNGGVSDPAIGDFLKQLQNETKLRREDADAAAKGRDATIALTEKRKVEAEAIKNGIDISAGLPKVLQDELNVRIRLAQAVNDNTKALKAGESIQKKADNELALIRAQVIEHKALFEARQSGIKQTEEDAAVQAAVTAALEKVRGASASVRAEIAAAAAQNERYVLSTKDVAEAQRQAAEAMKKEGDAVASIIAQYTPKIDELQKKENELIAVLVSGQTIRDNFGNILGAGDINAAIAGIERAKAATTDWAESYKKLGNEISNGVRKGLENVVDDLANIGQANKTWKQQVIDVAKEFEKLALKLFVVEPLMKRFQEAGHAAFPHLLPDAAQDPSQQAAKAAGLPVPGLFDGGTGLSGFLKGLFGFGGGATSSAQGGATLTAAGTSLTSSGTVLTSAGTVLHAAAAALEAAAAKLSLGSASGGSSGGGFGNILSSLFGSSGGSAIPGTDMSGFMAGDSFLSGGGGASFIPGFAKGGTAGSDGDPMLAILHKGEHVLTQSEARDYKNGKSGKQMPDIHLHYHEAPGGSGRGMNQSKRQALSDMRDAVSKGVN